MNKLLKLRPLLLILMSVLVKFTWAQAPTFDKMVDFLPPAPNAAAITKYGDMSVNKNNGRPNVSIPLFTIKGTKLSTAVSLGYSSNGIKVDEIASRVGMGWAINAGGVITRAMRGRADEVNTRHYPYAQIGNNWATYNYMKRIEDGQIQDVYAGYYDSEPDLFSFSFDGYSGSFVFNGDGFIQVNKSGIKVEKDFTTAPSVWNFKITTPDGNMYFFGGASAVEKTKRTNYNCGRTHNDFIPSAWYLKEIQHPNGEKITFNYIPISYSYDNGVSQTMYNPGLSGLGSGCSCGYIPPSTCVNITNISGVLLSSIEITGKALISFEYISRDDCSDNLISKITYKDPVNTISSFDLEYNTITSSSAYNNLSYYGQNKTPYLVSLTENSSDNSLHKKHYFSYIDPEGRPSRLSYSQDHWGFFNGKVNTSFMPDLGVEYHDRFPLATANRDPDFAYSKKGLLQKVVYPTGGTTSLFYGPNISQTSVFDVGINATLHKLSCDVTGTGLYTQAEKSITFSQQINTTQAVQIQLEVRNNYAPQEPDPVHQFGSLKILNLTNNTVAFPQTSYTVGTNQTITVYLPPSVYGNDYQLVLTANGAQVTTLATVNYYPKINTSSTSNGYEAGGMRIEKIATAIPGGTPMVKKYYYGTLSDLNTSSLAYVAKPIYTGTMYKITNNCNSNQGFVCEYNTITSSSIFNLGYFNNDLVCYSNVVEGIGENFEGGGTETKFYAGPDALGVVMWNKDIMNSPFSNFSSLYNGKPISETVVKKLPNSNLVPVKKTEYTYKRNTGGDNEIYGYTVVHRVPGSNPTDTTCDVTINCSVVLSCCNVLQTLLSAYDMVRYSVFSSFITPESVTETMYDENGQNPLVTTNNSYYENLQNYQLTRTEAVNSKGKVIQTVNKYPHDYAGTTVYDEMISKNIISPLVNSKTQIPATGSPSATPLSEQQIDYSNVGNNNYAPSVIKKSVKGNQLETEGTIDAYDDRGNILQFTGKSGIVTSIVWGYNEQYPVAQVVGAGYATVIAQLTGGTVTALQTMDGTTLLTELNRVRTNLTSAKVTSYTYLHLKGIHTITDPNNKTNTYEYDAFNRLQIIKDQDGNVVKKNEYVYATPDPNTGLTIFYNAAASPSPAVVCNSCVQGYVASTTNPASYSVPYGKYYSLINQADADAKATADLAANAQAIVNNNSICTNAGTCTGAEYKFVSCACEKGVRICEYSTPDGNGGWIARVHYRWSDGSVSPSFNDNIASCSGIDKKFLNCTCETGMRVCEGSTNNGGGSYTLTYHYHFSDNSNSSSVTETVTCSGIDKKIVNCTCETAIKVYATSDYCNLSNSGGCCSKKWRCGFYYKWSDNSTLYNTGNTLFYECADESCIQISSTDDGE